MTSKTFSGLLKKILKRRRDLKLIVSSATVDAEYIRDFFNRGVKKGGDKAAATILSVEGRNYSVDVLYQAVCRIRKDFFRIWIRL